MQRCYLLFLLVGLTSFSCSPPHDETTTKPWFKGNLHTHSYWSDGDEFPEVILDWYKTHGYQFVALSDHNTIAEDEKWVTLSPDSIYQNAFQHYLQSYGPDWVEYREDSGRTEVKLKPYEVYSSRYEEAGRFLVIHSEEISDKFDNKPLHMNATNIRFKLKPRGGNSVAEVLQHNIDAVLHQRDSTGVPMIPHINHPNFYYAITLRDMIALHGERFFEVYNGHPLVHNSGDSTHISTEEMWDLINIAYLQANKPLIYGLATDDSHNYHQQGNTWSNAGRGWIMVHADSLTPASLISSMEDGQFYATTGVELSAVTFENNKLDVRVKEEPGVTYTLTFIGCRKGEATPVEFQSTDGADATFDMTDDILYARCRVTSSKLQSNPIENIRYEMAWTQPVTRN